MQILNYRGYRIRQYCLRHVLLYKRVVFTRAHSSHNGWMGFYRHPEDRKLDELGGTHTHTSVWLGMGSPKGRRRQRRAPRRLVWALHQRWGKGTEAVVGPKHRADSKAKVWSGTVRMLRWRRGGTNGCPGSEGVGWDLANTRTRAWAMSCLWELLYSYDRGEPVVSYEWTG